MTSSRLDPLVRAAASAAPGWRTAVATSAAIALLFLICASRTTLWDRDEPRFAAAAVQMAESGQYLYPTFNGEVRPHKPILIYWLMTLSIRLLGPTELAVRCWSALGVGIAGFFTYAMGRFLFDARTGWIAMLVLATSPLVMLEGLAATTDAMLLAAIAAAMTTLVLMLRDGPSVTRTLGMSAALSVGTLLKGPVAPAFVALTFAGTWWLMRREGGANRFGTVAIHLALALAACVAAYLAWAVPANAATEGRIVNEGLGREVLRRIVEPLEGHGAALWWTWPYYLVVVIVGMLPWLWMLPAAIDGVARGARAEAMTRALLLSWIVLPILAFTLIATKLPHYILPIWPALALVVARGINRLQASGVRLQGANPAGFSRSPKPEARPPTPSLRRSAEAGQRRTSEGGSQIRWQRIGWVLFTVVATALAAIGVVAAMLAPTTALQLGLLSLIAVAGFTAVLSWRNRDQPPRATAAVVAGVTSSLVVCALWLGPAAEALKPVPRVAAAIRNRTPADMPVYTFDFAEPSLVFYVNRVPVRHLPGEADVARWVASGEPGVLVTTRSAIDRLQRTIDVGRLRELASHSGINYSKGDWIELVALEKRPAP